MSKGRVTHLVVEGPTDQTFLAEPLQQLFALTSQSVQFAVLGNDVTSDERLSDKSFMSRIWSSIASTLSQLGLCKSDLSRIIQITDLDGAFIPDSNIVGGWKGNELFYTDNCIHAKDAQEIRRRNARKRRRIDTLLQTNSLSGIPYLLCYMSQNIEHVLVDERNCFYKNKKLLAKERRSQWGKDLSTFKSIMQKYNDSCQTWQESWAYVRTGLHSLERGTNLARCFPDGWMDSCDPSSIS